MLTLKKLSVINPRASRRHNNVQIVKYF